MCYAVVGIQSTGLRGMTLGDEMRKATLAMLLVVFAEYVGNAQTTAIHPSSAAPASPEEACAFITSQMRSTMPQTPTLCSGKQGVPGYYDLNVFAPTAVFESSSRRAYSSALFQAIEAFGTAKSLAGACTKITCIVTVSDADMVKHSVHYKAFVNESLFQMANQDRAFSEEWYLSWWQRLLRGTESDQTRDRDTVVRLADSVCADFLRSIQEQAALMKATLPKCSVMLATDSTLYLVLDYQNSIADVLLADDRWTLVKKLGKAFDYSGYDGQVIVRSAWDYEHDKDGPIRIYRMYPIRDLSFAYKESEVENGSNLYSLLDLLERAGQQRQNTLRLDSSVGNRSIMRTVAVLKYSLNAGGHVTLDTTDGAEWSVSREAFERCSIHEGDDVEISTLRISGNADSLGGPPKLTKENDGVPCEVEAEFLKGLVIHLHQFASICRIHVCI